MNDPDPDDDAYLRTLFLERVTHELRSPLGVIDGALQELECALGEDAANHRGLLDMARRGIRRLARTADRLQQTAMCERARLDLEWQRCDLASLVRCLEEERSGRPHLGEFLDRWRASARRCLHPPGRLRPWGRSRRVHSPRPTRRRPRSRR